jgi:hypothetical protein
LTRLEEAAGGGGGLFAQGDAEHARRGKVELVHGAKAKGRLRVAQRAKARVQLRVERHQLVRVVHMKVVLLEDE